jgi:hypothetical protein
MIALMVGYALRLRNVQPIPIRKPTTIAVPLFMVCVTSDSVPE